MKSEEVNAFLSPGYDCGKVLIEDDREDGCGKGGVGKIVHHPAEDLAFLNRHFSTSFQKKSPFIPL
jgi:hypothetical protein